MDQDRDRCREKDHDRRRDRLDQGNRFRLYLLKKSFKRRKRRKYRRRDRLLHRDRLNRQCGEKLFGILERKIADQKFWIIKDRVDRKTNLIAFMKRNVMNHSFAIDIRSVFRVIVKNSIFDREMEQRDCRIEFAKAFSTNFDSVFESAQKERFYFFLIGISVGSGSFVFDLVWVR